MGANVVGRKHVGLRKRMARFARLRSANRALPATAGDMHESETREKEAAAIRAKFSKLADTEAPAAEIAKAIKAASSTIDVQLAAMERDLLGRFDALPFVSLRAAVPRAVEGHRREVVSLLELLLGDRTNLLERLPQVEYLITMLATDEVDGRRNIVNDPSSISPVLETFEVEGSSRKELDAIAMELFQAATLDSESENFDAVLKSIRERKRKIGLGCLTQPVLRAVVTYNARMFNSVESLAENSRAHDALLEEALAESGSDEDLFGDLDFEETSDLLGANAEPKAAAPTPPPAAEPLSQRLRSTDDSSEGTPEPGAPQDVAIDDSAESAADEVEEVIDEGEAESVFDSDVLQGVIDALRIRIDGGVVGRRGPAERIAIVLDKGCLEEIEIRALCADEPNSDEAIVSRTVAVGLMLRDFGAVRDAAIELGMKETVLSDTWVRELNESFGQLISAKLADPKAYELTSKLSGIKSKHLFKPFNALNAARRGQQAERLFAGDTAADEMRDVARAAVAKDQKKASSGSRVVGQGSAGFSPGDGRVKLIAAAALVTVAFALGVSNFIGAIPSDIETLNAGSLSDTSEFLRSAYRNQDGRGPLVIGQLDSVFDELSVEAKVEAAEGMVENFEFQGVREAMLYDSRGAMQVHFSAGMLHRPRLGDRTTGHAPGEASKRRTLTGTLLDEVEEGDDGDSDENDRWGGR